MYTGLLSRVTWKCGSSKGAQQTGGEVTIIGRTRIFTAHGLQKIVRTCFSQHILIISFVDVRNYAKQLCKFLETGLLDSASFTVRRT